MATTNRKKLGPRTSVLVGTVKKKVGGKDVTVKLVSNMAASTAALFGFKSETIRSTPAKTSGGKTKAPRLIRGSKGAGSIKVPAGTTSKAKGGVVKYVSIPMPAGTTLNQIEAFLKKATKNKPTSFVSKDGRTHPIAIKK